MTQNHFSDLVTDVQQCSPKDKPDHLISGIAQRMQAASSDPTTTRQLSQELKQAQPQLVRAFQGD